MSWVENLLLLLILLHDLAEYRLCLFGLRNTVSSYWLDEPCPPSQGQISGKLGSRVMEFLSLPCTAGMAAKKGGSILIKLLSTAGTGYFYVKRKNPRTMPQKLQLMKFDPKVNKHVLFTEAKLK